MIILDTHILIWWLSNPEKLSAKINKLIEKNRDEGQILVSSISVWEICLLVKKGRLGLSLDLDSWLEKLESLPIQFIPVDNDIAKKAVNLPGDFHQDPADRLIVATSRKFGALLLTEDQKIVNYPYVKSV